MFVSSQMINNVDKILEKKAKQFLKKTFLSRMTVDEKELDSLIDLFELDLFRKNQIILDEGETPQHFYFIYKGIISIYFYKNEKPVIERFEKEGGFFGSNFTHITKKPGIHVYEAQEDIIVLKIRYKDLSRLCWKSHDIERVYRMSLELLYCNYVSNFYKFAALGSDERYHQFMLDYGDITNRVSLKYVANYLGMTSETLSRIRSKYDKNIKTHK